jgi:hypothetical protein
VLTIWGIVDASSWPDWGVGAVEAEQGRLVLMPIIALFVCLGWILSIVYPAAIRSIAWYQQ